MSTQPLGIRIRGRVRDSYVLYEATQVHLQLEAAWVRGIRAARLGLSPYWVFIKLQST